ncbi:MAG: tetratricopeptide repeat protein [Bacteroidetes bacterium]|nr:tetratricopeptide repeat protein [Bacteroidota bacterium]
MKCITLICVLLVYSLYCLSQQSDPETEEQYNKAQAFYDAKEYEKAIGIYDKVIAKNPVHADAIFYRGISHGELENYEAAIGDMRKLTEMMPGYPVAWNCIGWYLILQGKTPQAYDYIKKANDLDNTMMPNVLNMGHFYMHSGDKKTARKFYEDALLLLASEDEFDLVLEDFGKFIAKDMNTASSKELRDWIKTEFETKYIFKFNAIRKHNEGYDLYEQGEYEKALLLFLQSIEIWQGALVKYPDNMALTYNFAGLSNLDMGHLDEAIRWFEKAASSHAKAGNFKDAAVSRANIAYTYRVMTRFDEAVTIYEEIISETRKQGTNADLAGYLNDLGLTYQDMAEYQKSVETFREAMELYRSENDAANVAVITGNIGLSMQKSGDYKNAAVYLKQALDQNLEKGNTGSVVANYINLASLYEETGDFRSAREMLEKGMETDRGAGSRYENYLCEHLGYVYYSARQHADAVIWYEKALDAVTEKTDKPGMIRANNYLGMTYHQWEKYDKALEYYEKALALSQETGVEQEIISCYNNIGSVLSFTGMYPQAKEYLEKGLKQAQKSGIRTKEALLLDNIGNLFFQQYDFEKAVRYYNESAELYKMYGTVNDYTGMMNTIGFCYDNWGRYDKALEYYRKALDICLSSGIPIMEGDINSNIGCIYLSWGKFDRAMQYFEEAKRIHSGFGNENNVSVDLSNIGIVYDAWDKPEKAMECFLQALELARKNGTRKQEMAYLKNIADLYKSMGEYGKAIDYYNQVRELQLKYGTKADVAGTLSSVSTILAMSMDYDEAVEAIELAIELSEQSNNKQHTAAIYGQAGTIYGSLMKFDVAIGYLNKAVDIYEEIRTSAPAETRKEYLALQITAYERLAVNYLRNRDYENAFKIIELYKAKQLTEQIAGRSGYKIPSLADVQNDLPEGTAVIMYAAVNEDNLVEMVITKETIFSFEKSKSYFQKTFLSKSDTLITGQVTAQLAHRNAEMADAGEDILREEVSKAICDFDLYIRYYRQLLQKYYPNEQEKEYMISVSRIMYDFLIGPLEKQLEGMKEIVIIPDGILGLIPFETLADKEGKYLVERFDVRYVQSMSVMALIRSRMYNDSRKPALAIGGAVYRKETYEKDMALASDLKNRNVQASLLTKSLVSADYTNSTLRYYRLKVEEEAKQSSSLLNVYREMGLSSCGNLPGSLTEIRNMKTIIPDMDTLTARNASETNIKQLSMEGKLQNYKVLHFSTHGITLSEIPELSAIILTLDEQGKEDGFLRSDEIAGLSIHADFVNLSACETGLGKIYKGEGVVGLSQSFLVAGANSISASLWQVADESTAKFMSELYRLKEQENMTYSRAVNEVKRRFIRGEYSKWWVSPFFWAPFVYYGE